jgi:hypothetical protein
MLIGNGDWPKSNTFGAFGGRDRTERHIPNNHTVDIRDKRHRKAVCPSKRIDKPRLSVGRKARGEKIANH